MQFERLFTPITIRNKTIKNRIISPAHAGLFNFFRDELPPDQYIEYQRARAKGGCGLIVLSNCQVHKSSSGSNLYPPTPEILAPKLKRMADTLHEYGTVVTMQLFHRGNTGNTVENIHANWGFTPLPSHEAGAEVCHEMNDAEIEEIIKSYILYAKLSKECGLDGIELHGAHGYFLQQSWTNWANLRTDKWGKQMALVNELISRVRAAVGEDFLIDVKIVSDDFHAGGMDNVAMQKVAQALEATGKIDFLSISQGSQASHYAFITGTMYYPPAVFVPLASGIKQAVKSIPIVAATRINDPALAESILADGHADMIAICRAQIADPEFANKAREGRVDDIRLCIACNQGCQDRTSQRMRITCVQNAAVGWENQIGTITKAARKKKVLVVGGGPAGMEAARVAALRGHDVTLYEKTEQLGGLINVLGKVPSREEFKQVVRYLTAQLGKLNVNVKLGVEAKAETIKKEKPDAVIIATGSTPFKPSIPGVDQKNVLTVQQALEGAPVGDRVLIYDTPGYQEAVTLAEFLADQGKKVEIATPSSQVGQMIGSSHQPHIWPLLQNKGVVFSVFTSLKKIAGSTVTLANVFTQQERTVEVDTVVTSTGYRANDALWRTLTGQVPELYAVGDCYAPRRALDAIHEGYNTAFKI